MYLTLCGQHFVIDFSFKYFVCHNSLNLSARIHKNSRFAKCWLVYLSLRDGQTLWFY